MNKEKELMTLEEVKRVFNNESRTLNMNVPMEALRQYLVRDDIYNHVANNITKHFIGKAVITRGLLLHAIMEELEKIIGDTYLWTVNQPHYNTGIATRVMQGMTFIEDVKNYYRTGKLLPEPTMELTIEIEEADEVLYDHEAETKEAEQSKADEQAEKVRLARELVAKSKTSQARQIVQEAPKVKQRPIKQEEETNTNWATWDTPEYDVDTNSPYSIAGPDNFEGGTSEADIDFLRSLVDL